MRYSMGYKNDASIMLCPALHVKNEST
jgi:hypothetical protein